MYVSVGPVIPCGPVGPGIVLAAPVGPCIPCGPVGPVIPCGPMGPVAIHARWHFFGCKIVYDPTLYASITIRNKKYQTR